MRGDGRVFKRPNSPFWWIGYYGPGSRREIRESTGIKIADDPEKKKATKILRDKRRAVLNHKDGIQTFTGPKSEKLTVKDLCESLMEDYKHRNVKGLKKTMTSRVKQAMEALGHVRAVNLTTDMLREACAVWKEQGLSNGTIKTFLSVYSAAFELAIREKKIHSKPYIPYPSTKDNVRKGVVGQLQYELMLRNLPEPAGDMLRFGFISGWRWGEIGGLKWEYVNRQERVIVIPDSKNGQGRSLPLDEEMLEIIERQWSRRAFGDKLAEYVFHREGERYAYGTFYEHWNDAKVAAGDSCKGLWFHDLRRTALTRLTAAGVAIPIAMTISGHRSMSTFLRYNIFNVDHQRDALAKAREHANIVKGNVTEMSR